MDGAPRRGADDGTARAGEMAGGRARCDGLTGHRLDENGLRRHASDLSLRDILRGRKRRKSGDNGCTLQARNRRLSDGIHLRLRPALKAGVC